MISKDKKYKTKNGLPFKLYEIYKDRIHGAYGFDENLTAANWNIDGSFSKTESCLDLIEISPYADFKIDDKCLFWNNYSNIKQRGYFAGVHGETGKPMRWDNGATSFTNTDEPYDWDYCIKYEENNDD